MLRRVLFSATLLAALGATVARAEVLWEEDFESVALGPIVTFGDSDTGGETPSREAWSPVAPNGIVVDRSGVPGDPINEGVPEFRGWTFVDDEWWTATAGDQNRSAWTRGYGTIATADNDEFDDFSLGVGEGVGPAFDGCSASINGCYNSSITTPAISLSGVPENSVNLVFDSSYRPEHEQDVSLEVSYDGGTTYTQLFKWVSTDSAGVESVFTQATDDNGDPIFNDIGRPVGSFNSLGNFVRVESGSEYDGTEFENGTIFADNTQVDQIIDIPLNNPAGAGSVMVRWNMLDAGNDWWWGIDNIQVYTGEAGPRDPALTAVVDTDTGAVTISNGTSQTVALTGYQILSDDGAFNETAAQFQADADGSDWVQLTAAGDGSDLSEGYTLPSGFELASGESITLGEGAWENYFSEDVSFSYVVAGSAEPVRGLVEFGGDGVYDFLDLDFDRDVDIDDYVTWLAITDTADLSDLTVAQAYRKGDLDGDLRLGVGDFVVFQSTFNSLFGAGAFAEAVAGLAVPEPTSATLIALAAFGVAARRRG